jgi:hypothetical protein
MKFADWLTILFIAFKLNHTIDWPWWVVVSPIVIVLMGGFLLRRLILWAQKRKGLQEKT